MGLPGAYGRTPRALLAPRPGFPELPSSPRPTIRLPRASVAASCAQRPKQPLVRGASPLTKSATPSREQLHDSRAEVATDTVHKRARLLLLVPLALAGTAAGLSAVHGEVTRPSLLVHRAPKPATRAWHAWHCSSTAAHHTMPARSCAPAWKTASRGRSSLARDTRRGPEEMDNKACIPRAHHVHARVCALRSGLNLCMRALTNAETQT